MPRTRAITAAFVLFVFGVVAPASADQVTAWNELGAQAAVAAGQSIPVSRTLAMAQIAVHDALNAIDPRYEPYAFRGTYPGASADAAIATAAHHTRDVTERTSPSRFDSVSSGPKSRKFVGLRMTTSRRKRPSTLVASLDAVAGRSTSTP